MARRIVTASGSIDVMLTCTDSALVGRIDAIDFGFLQGRWLVHSWPNADMRLFVNDAGVYPRPGMVLDFPKAARVTAESLPLLADLHCVLIALAGKSGSRAEAADPGRLPAFQWQRVCRSQRVPDSTNQSLTDSAGFVSRIDGYVLVRAYFDAAIPAGATLQLAGRCSGGALNYVWPAFTLTGQPQRFETAYNMGSGYGYFVARMTSGVLYDFLCRQTSGAPINVSLDVGAGIP